MSKRSLERLRALCLTPAPSGFERDIAVKLKAYLTPFCDGIETDNVGNVVGKICGSDSSLEPVLINAHMDRIGVIVSNITDDGYLRLEKIGWLNDKVMPGLNLVIRNRRRTEWLPVTVGTKCSHLMTPEEQKMAQPLGELMIDSGCDSAEAVRARGIEIGSPGVYMPTFTRITETRVCATALDNCGSVAALIGIAEILNGSRPIRDVYVAGNVWEEYNQRGAALIVNRLRPAAVVSMDMLLAGDTPDTHGHFCGALGKGPMVSWFNFSDRPCNGTIAHEGLYDLMEETAEELGTGLQRYVCVGGLGDNAYSQLAGDGPACIEIGAPVRYAHSSGEVADIADIDNLARLVAGAVRKLGPGFCRKRYELD
ncbi:MAG: M42 family metallopeptidase [Oscillospiraceae bacterium]